MRRFALLSLLLLTACGENGEICVMFCEDQTRLQRNYVNTRDQCRADVEQKMGINPEDPNTQPKTKAAKSKVVSLFSECMNAQGWAIPNPDTKTEEAKPAPAPAPQKKIMETVYVPKPIPNPVPVPVPTPVRVEVPVKPQLTDCDFARQAASASVISAHKAEECDRECASARKSGRASKTCPQR